jgi:hypothetical protein
VYTTRASFHNDSLSRLEEADRHLSAAREGPRAPPEGSGEVARAGGYERKEGSHAASTRRSHQASCATGTCFVGLAAQRDEDLLWLETDLESDAEERGQTATMVRLLDRVDERVKGEIEAIDRALMRIGTGSPRLKGGLP